MVQTRGKHIWAAAAVGYLEYIEGSKKNAFKDDLPLLRKICEECRDFPTGRNALHVAAGAGHIDICRYLIEQIGVYIDARSYNGDSALIEAAKGGHVAVVQYLSERGASLTEPNLDGFTALHYSVLRSDEDLLQWLLTHPDLVDLVNANSIVGMPLQCADSNVNDVQSLLDNGVKPSIHFRNLESPLACAIKLNSFECFNLILPRADPNHYYIGFSPLSYAARASDMRFLNALLVAGAEPNSPMTGHVKPIEEAALANNLLGVRTLCRVTDELPHYPRWSVKRIMEFSHSKEAKEKREKSKSALLAALDKAGHAAMDLGHVLRAAVHFRQASVLDPSNNAKWASKGSLCFYKVGLHDLALSDAKECLRLGLRPTTPHRLRLGLCPTTPHHGDTAAATCIFETFVMAGLDFVLDPGDIEVHYEFRRALFDYFAWLYLRSSPEEILRVKDLTSMDSLMQLWKPAFARIITEEEVLSLTH